MTGDHLKARILAALRRARGPIDSGTISRLCAKGMPHPAQQTNAALRHLWRCKAVTRRRPVRVGPGRPAWRWEVQMDDDRLVSLMEAAQLLDRSYKTVSGWADAGDLSPLVWSKGKRLVRWGLVKIVSARKEGTRGYNRGRPDRDPTAAELERMIADQLDRLPRWWWDDVAKLNGRVFADRKRAEYEANQRRAA